MTSHIQLVPAVRLFGLADGALEYDLTRLTYSPSESAWDYIHGTLRGWGVSDDHRGTTLEAAAHGSVVLNPPNSSLYLIAESIGVFHVPLYRRHLPDTPFAQNQQSITDIVERGEEKTFFTRDGDGSRWEVSCLPRHRNV